MVEVVLQQPYWPAKVFGIPDHIDTVLITLDHSTHQTSLLLKQFQYVVVKIRLYLLHV